MPYLEDTAYLHSCGHQQPMYSYMPLTPLSRSEVPEPNHVLRTIQEILLSKAHKRLMPYSSNHDRPRSNPEWWRKMRRVQSTIIIDGNHRGTATILLHLLATEAWDSHR